MCLYLKEVNLTVLIKLTDLFWIIFVIDVDMQETKRLYKIISSLRIEKYMQLDV